MTRWHFEIMSRGKVIATGSREFSDSSRELSQRLGWEIFLEMGIVVFPLRVVFDNGEEYSVNMELVVT